jgi:hypothetical protein
MDIFKIDENKSIVVLANGGKRFTRTKTNPLNLRNLNEYNEKGELIKNANSKEYIEDFLLECCKKHITANNFFNFILYHYENSENKREYLSLLKYDLMNLKLFTIEANKSVLKDFIKEIELDIDPEKSINKTDLTERLLIVRYLQNESLFPTFDSSKGETATNINEFLAILLSEKTDTIKKGFQRVDKIISNKELTKENKSDRLKQLNNVLKYFNQINQYSIAEKIKELIKTINSKS